MFDDSKIDNISIENPLNLSNTQHCQLKRQTSKDAENGMKQKLNGRFSPSVLRASGSWNNKP